jgi:hypothetical protein
MKALNLALAAVVSFAMVAPAFSAGNPQPQNGSLAYSGNFLTFKDANHRITLTTDGRQRVFVASVWPDGWMGLHSSDQIERIDGQPVRWVGQLVEQLKNRSPTPVVLTVYHHDIDMRVYEQRDLQFAYVDYAKFVPKG